MPRMERRSTIPSPLQVSPGHRRGLFCCAHIQQCAGALAARTSPESSCRA